MTSDDGTGGADMDPIVGAAVAKAAGSAKEETGKLLGRVLGPAADEIGDALGRYTAQRMKNVGRIVAKADKKSGGKSGGEVPPRLAHNLLEDGSYCDDELMAEYLSGVLAGGRTPNGRDDRAVAWSSVVLGMSTLQLRAHFMLYREWAALLKGQRTDLLDGGTGRRECELIVSLDEFVERLVLDLDVEPVSALAHAITGLVRMGLIDATFSYGPRTADDLADSPYHSSVRVYPSIDGAELYGWALGVPGMTGKAFIFGASPFGEDEISRLPSASLPRLGVGTPRLDLNG